MTFMLPGHPGKWVDLLAGVHFDKVFFPKRCPATPANGSTYLPGYILTMFLSEMLPGHPGKWVDLSAGVPFVEPTSCCLL